MQVLRNNRKNVALSLKESIGTSDQVKSMIIEQSVLSVGNFKLLKDLRFLHFSVRLDSIVDFRIFYLRQFSQLQIIDIKEYDCRFPLTSLQNLKQLYCLSIEGVFHSFCFLHNLQCLEQLCIKSQQQLPRDIEHFKSL